MDGNTPRLTDDVPLTAEQVERYRHEGYVGPFPLGEPPAWLDAARAQIEREVLPTRSPDSGNYNQARHLDRRVIYDLCSHPSIVGRIASLFGADLLLWQSNLFVKNPGDREFPWHQDVNY